MGNCLVTKLKDSVDNPNLPKLGVLRFTVVVEETPARTNLFHVVENNKSLLTIISGPIGGTIKKVVSSSDIDMGTSFYLDKTMDTYTFSVAGTYVIEITEKYNLSYFNVGDNVTISTSDLKYCKSLKSFNVVGNNVLGNLSDLCIEGMQSIRINTKQNNIVGELKDLTPCLNTLNSVIFLNCPGISGDISIFSGNSVITTIALNNETGTKTKYTGDISSITSIPNLTNFQCPNTFVSGTLASLLDNGALKNPKLNILVISNTPNLTKSSEDVATLRSLGVSVTT